MRIMVNTFTAAASNLENTRYSASIHATLMGGKKVT
jgi:hypothetical protein